MTISARQLGNARLSMLNKPRELSTREEFAADIRRNWLNALEATVQVGRRLNEAKAKLPHGEYEAMVEQDLPFKAPTARKLREVAEFVDSGKVPLEQLPEAYSTVYAIATMPEERRQEALDQRVIRPDVTRRELEAFKAPKPVGDKPPTSEPEFSTPPHLQAPFASAEEVPVSLPTTLNVIQVNPVPIDIGVASQGENSRLLSMISTDLMARPWHLNKKELGVVGADVEGFGAVTILVVDPHHDTGLDDVSVSAIAEHIVRLHNAAFTGQP